MDKTDFKLSKQAQAMIKELDELTISEINWVNDMALGIATTLKEVTSGIENPPKDRVKDCEVIHLGADLFAPMFRLKKEINNGINLKYYLTDLDEVVEKLGTLLEKNYPVLKNPRVRRHMKNMANTIILDLEAGPILNGLFKKFEELLEARFF